MVPRPAIPVVMLRGERIGLRARVEADVPVLRAELYDDVTTTNRAYPHPWRPISPAPDAPYGVVAPSDTRHPFSIVALETDELLGHASVWGIDVAHRLGHLGIGLLPTARGRGFAGDVIRTLCYYGFVVQGLHRLQVDTLADNEPMIRTAVRCGFVHEGRTRASAWFEGRFIDEVIMGLLDSEWRAARGDEKPLAPE